METIKRQTRAAYGCLVACSKSHGCGLCPRRLYTRSVCDTIAPLQLHLPFVVLYKCNAFNVWSAGATSELELPTPLHLAAKYGLSELTTRLLDLPDAIHASAIANCDHQYPDDLARACHRRSLAAAIENFREVVSVRVRRLNLYFYQKGLKKMASRRP